MLAPILTLCLFAGPSCLLQDSSTARGRLVGPDGPLVGVSIELLQVGGAVAGEDLTDEEGRFEILNDVEGILSLVVSDPRYLTTRPSQARAGNFGDVEVLFAEEVSLILVDASGEIVMDDQVGISVFDERVERTSFLSFHTLGPPDPDTGRRAARIGLRDSNATFRLVVAVRQSHPVVGRTFDRTLDLLRGQATGLVFELDWHDPQRWLAVDLERQGERHTLSGARILNPEGGEMPWSRHNHHSMVALDVDPGEAYSLVLRDPRFVSQRVGLVPGQVTKVELEYSSALHVSRGVEPVEGVLTLRGLDGGVVRTREPLPGESSAPLVLSDCPPGDWVLHARHPKHLGVEAFIRGLQPGEQRSVDWDAVVAGRVEVRGTLALGGRLVTGAHRVWALHADLERLLPKGAVERAEAFRNLAGARAPTQGAGALAAKGETFQGRFRLHLARGGEWLILVEQGGGYFLESRLMTRSSRPARLDLTLPPKAVLHLALRLPAGTSPEAYLVQLDTPGRTLRVWESESRSGWWLGKTSSSVPGGTCQLRLDQVATIDGKPGMTLPLLRTELDFDPEQDEPLLLDLRETLPVLLNVDLTAVLSSSPPFLVAGDAVLELLAVAETQLFLSACEGRGGRLRRGMIALDAGSNPLWGRWARARLGLEDGGCLGGLARRRGALEARPTSTHAPRAGERRGRPSGPRAPPLVHARPRAPWCARTAWRGRQRDPDAAPRPGRVPGGRAPCRIGFRARTAACAAARTIRGRTLNFEPPSTLPL